MLYQLCKLHLILPKENLLSALIIHVYIYHLWQAGFISHVVHLVWQTLLSEVPAVEKQEEAALFCRIFTCLNVCEQDFPTKCLTDVKVKTRFGDLKHLWRGENRQLRNNQRSYFLQTVSMWSYLIGRRSGQLIWPWCQPVSNPEPELLNQANGSRG